MFGTFNGDGHGRDGRIRDADNGLAHTHDRAGIRADNEAGADKPPPPAVGHRKVGPL